jgi:hypothetical protein
MAQLNQMKKDFMEGLIKIEDDSNLQYLVFSVCEDLESEGFDREDIEKLIHIKVTEYLALVE